VTNVVRFPGTNRPPRLAFVKIAELQLVETCQRVFVVDACFDDSSTLNLTIESNLSAARSAARAFADRGEDLLVELWG